MGYGALFMYIRATEIEYRGVFWYCARTRPKHEHIAAASLERKLSLEVFHPRLRLEKATRRGVVRSVEPLFPCYIFIRCDAEVLQEVRYVPGISSLVRFGDRVPVVPDEVVEELRQCFEMGEPMEVQEPLMPGSEVTVAEGAFMGSSGIVLKVLPARRRVQILLDFLGRTTVAEVDRKSLQVEHRSLADLLPTIALGRSAVAAA